jgi:hypothetical protein
MLRLAWALALVLLAISSALQFARGPVSAPRESFKRISAEAFSREVKVFRGLTCAAGTLLALNYPACNAAVVAFYEHLKGFQLFHHFSFEPLFASTCFAVYIAAFAAIDYWVPSMWKYRIQNEGTGDSLDSWKDRLKDALTLEVPLYLFLWIPFGGFVRARKIQQTTSLALVAKEVVAGLLLYDTFFYFGHRMIHRFSWLFNNVHKKHHSMVTVRAGDSVRHTFLDGVFDVVCAVAALMILQANALSRLVFNAVAIFLIVENHCGLLLPISPSALAPAVFCGPVAHDLHHQTGRGNYAKFFHLDSLLGTRIVS